jgi:prepilin-type N-terminal cleavage/methylation domain-containing protein
MSKRFVKKGFTLIELLVVVAIIALLISILLPSLRDAREQAKVAKCLANYRQVNTTAVSYFLDNADNFPFWDRDPNSPYNGGICTWRWGGRTAWQDYWQNENSGSFFIKAQDRPFNEYLLGSKVEPDLWIGGKIEAYTEIPVLTCPSDKVSHQRMFSGSATDVWGDSSYKDVGTSYHYNAHSLFDKLAWGTGHDSNFWSAPGDWQEAGLLLVKQVLAKHSGTYVMFLEDSMDWAMGGTDEPISEMGNHGKFDRHCMGFLDGHAEYKQADTDGNWCGVGWAVINPEWISRPGRIPQPAHYWPLSRKINCDPKPKN